MGRAALAKRFLRPAFAGLLTVVLLLSSAASSRAQAPPVKGAAALAVSNGFARMLVKLDEDVDVDASVAGNVLVVRFKRPVEIDIGKLVDAAPDYVSSARRDPDGMAIRFALTRKVKLSAMMAGERTFIDLLPDSWTSLPPGLPQSVVRELAERARSAERALKEQKASVDTRKRATLPSSPRRAQSQSQQHEGQKATHRKQHVGHQPELLECQHAQHPDQKPGDDHHQDPVEVDPSGEVGETVHLMSVQIRIEYTCN